MPPKGSKKSAEATNFAKMANDFCPKRVKQLQNTEEDRTKNAKFTPPQPQRGDIEVVASDMALSQLNYLDDYAYIDPDSIEKNRLPDLRAAPSRQLNKVMWQQQLILTSIAMNHDKIPTPFQIRTPQDSNGVNCIGLPNARFKFGSAAYAYLMTRQVSIYDLWQLFKSKSPTRVLPFFVEFNLDGAKSAAVKELQQGWKKEAKKGGEDYPEVFPADPSGVKPFADDHGEERRKFCIWTRGELTVRQAMEIWPKHIVDYVVKQEPEWFDLPQEDPDFRQETAYGGVDGRVPIPQPTAFYSKTGERYPPPWMLEGLSAPPPESIPRIARSLKHAPGAKLQSLLVKTVKTEVFDTSDSILLKASVTTPASIARPKFTRLSKVTRCQAMWDKMIPEDTENVDQGTLEIGYAACILAYWHSEGIAVWRWMPKNWCRSVFADCFKAVEDDRVLQVLVKEIDYRAKAHTDKDSDTTMPGLSQSLSQKFYASISQLIMSASTEELWQDENGDMHEQYNPLYLRAVLQLPCFPVQYRILLIDVLLTLAPSGQGLHYYDIDESYYEKKLLSVMTEHPDGVLHDDLPRPFPKQPKGPLKKTKAAGKKRVQATPEDDSDDEGTLDSAPVKAPVQKKQRMKAISYKEPSPDSDDPESIALAKERQERDDERAVARLAREARQASGEKKQEAASINAPDPESMALAKERRERDDEGAVARLAREARQASGGEKLEAASTNAPPAILDEGPAKKELPTTKPVPKVAKTTREAANKRPAAEKSADIARPHPDQATHIQLRRKMTRFTERHKISWLVRTPDVQKAFLDLYKESCAKHGEDSEYESVARKLGSLRLITGSRPEAIPYWNSTEDWTEIKPTYDALMSLNSEHMRLNIHGPRVYDVLYAQVSVEAKVAVVEHFVHEMLIADPRATIVLVCGNTDKVMKWFFKELRAQLNPVKAERVSFRAIDRYNFKEKFSDWQENRWPAANSRMAPLGRPTLKANHDPGSMLLGLLPVHDEWSPERRTSHLFLNGLYKGEFEDPREVAAKSLYQFRLMFPDATVDDMLDPRKVWPGLNDNNKLFGPGNPLTSAALSTIGLKKSSYEFDPSQRWQTPASTRGAVSNMANWCANNVAENSPWIKAVDRDALVKALKEVLALLKCANKRITDAAKLRLAASATPLARAVTGYPMSPEWMMVWDRYFDNDLHPTAELLRSCPKPQAAAVQDSDDTDDDKDSPNSPKGSVDGQHKKGSGFFSNI